MMCFLLSLLFLTAFTQSPKNIMGPKDSSSTSDDLPSDFHQRWQYDDGLSYFMQTGNNQWTEINWKGKITFHYVLIEEKPSFTLLYDISRNLYVKLTNSQLFFGNGRYSADSPSKRGAWVDKIQSIEGIEPNGIKRLSASDYNKKPIAAGDSVTDIDGNVYHVVKIGKQYWLQENLKTSHFSDSSVIPEMEYNTDWPYAGGPARCYYERNPQNNDPYGKLYNWYAAADPRNVCPAGWHVPSDKDFQTLSDYLGGDDIAGTHLKAIKLWGQQDENYADNASCFTALPAGIRYANASFDRSGADGADFWTSSLNPQLIPYCRILYYGGSNLGRHTYRRLGGFSVRCVGN